MGACNYFCPFLISRVWWYEEFFLWFYPCPIFDKAKSRHLLASNPLHMFRINSFFFNLSYSEIQVFSLSTLKFLHWFFLLSTELSRLLGKFTSQKFSASLFFIGHLFNMSSSDCSAYISSLLYDDYAFCWWFLVTTIKTALYRNYVQKQLCFY